MLNKHHTPTIVLAMVLAISGTPRAVATTSSSQSLSQDALRQAATKIESLNYLAVVSTTPEEQTTIMAQADPIENNGDRNEKSTLNWLWRLLPLILLIPLLGWLVLLRRSLSEKPLTDEDIRLQYKTSDTDTSLADSDGDVTESAQIASTLGTTASRKEVVAEPEPITQIFEVSESKVADKAKKQSSPVKQSKPDEIDSLFYWLDSEQNQTQELKESSTLSDSHLEDVSNSVELDALTTNTEQANWGDEVDEKIADTESEFGEEVFQSLEYLLEDSQPEQKEQNSKTNF